MSSIGSDLPKRVVVALILIGVAFAALWAGGIGFWLVVGAIGLLMMAEWSDLAGAAPRQKQMALAMLALPILAMLLARGDVALALVFAAAALVGILTRSPRMAGGILYVGLPVLALVVLRGMEQGFLLTFWAMALVWAADSGAFFAGRAIGGPKLAPQISPNKTWAGFLGGLAAATLFAWALVWLFALPPALAMATPLLAVLSQFGDLYESALKRRAGVKDSGDLLPGHGGVMDRLDGLVAVAPVAAVLALVFRA